MPLFVQKHPDAVKEANFVWAIYHGIAVVQNLAVDLADIGAVAADGTAYVGFTSRTGGNVQNSDITSWHLRSGVFSALPDFAEVKAILQIN